jgi:hypothetical protein
MSLSTSTIAEKRHQRRLHAVSAAFLIPRSSMRLWSVITKLVNIVIKKNALAREPEYLPAINQPQPMVPRGSACYSS